MVGTLPFVLLVGALVWQLALSGYAAWACANAARVASRSEAVGGDAEAAARSALPDMLERGLHVERPGGGLVRVAVRIPLLHPRWEGPVRVTAGARLQGR